MDKIEFKDKLVVNERIRDLINIEAKNYILILLENTPAILVIK